MRYTWQDFLKAIQNLIYAIWFAAVVTFFWTIETYSVCGVLFGFLICYVVIDRFVNLHPQMTMGEAARYFSPFTLLLMLIVSIIVGVTAAIFGIGTALPIWINIVSGIFLGVSILIFLISFMFLAGSSNN